MNKKGQWINGGWVPDYNSMELEEETIMLYLWENKRTPQNKEEEELMAELKAMKSRGMGIEIPCNGL